MSKAWKIAIISISSFLAVIMIFLGVYFLWPWNREFFNITKKEFEIPGLDTKFTPQGFSKIAGQDKYLISGYMSDGKPSRFYIVDENSENKYFTLSVNGQDYTGHAGGVVSAGSSIWTVGDGMCYCFKLGNIENIQNGQKIEVKYYFNALNGADFVYARDEILWIGEFYKAKKYETEKSHRLKTPSGETNPSLILGYVLDETLKGETKMSPVKAISVRGECQGIDITSQGRFVLSCSYGLKDSTLYYYENVLEETPVEFLLGKHEVELYYLDEDSLISETNMPAMSEEILIENNIVYILFESKAKKYRLFNRKRLGNVYSLAVDSLNK